MPLPRTSSTPGGGAPPGDGDATMSGASATTGVWWVASVVRALGDVASAADAATAKSPALR
jgi:hypothetical protein